MGETYSQQKGWVGTRIGRQTVLVTGVNLTYSTALAALPLTEALAYATKGSPFMGTSLTGTKVPVAPARTTRCSEVTVKVSILRGVLIVVKWIGIHLEVPAPVPLTGRAQSCAFGPIALIDRGIIQKRLRRRGGEEVRDFCHDSLL